MSNLQDILKNVISSGAIENKKPQEIKDIYNIFVENGYEKDYKSFQEDVLGYFMQHELSDKELDKISAGKTNNVNKILAGMFSALTISNTAMNSIYATPTGISQTSGHVAQTNIRATDKSLWEKFKSFFQNKMAAGVGIGVAAVLTPAIGVAFAGGYNYFTSVRYKFSQIISYCVENKGDARRNSIADQKYVNMLSDIIDYQIKEFDSTKKNNLSVGNSSKTSEISAVRARLDNFRLILSNKRNKVTIQRLGEIAADDFFLPILNHLEINSLNEFVSAYHIDTKTSLKKQLEEHKKESYDNQKELDNLKSLVKKLQTGLKNKDAELNKKIKELEDKISEKNAQLEHSQQEMRQLIDELQHITESHGKLSEEKEAELNKKIANQARMLQDYQNQLTELHNAMKQLRDRAKADDDRINDLEHERDRLRQKSEEDDKNLQELRAEIKNITESLHTANDEIAESKEKSDKMQKELERLNDALATLDKKEKDHIEEINKLEHERNLLMIKNQEDEKKLITLQEKIEKIQNTLRTANSAITISKAETDRLKEELERLKTAMEELKNQSENNIQKIKELELEKNKLIEQNQKSEEELEALRKEIGDINAKLDTANQELKDSKDKSEKLQQELAKLHDVITELNKKEKSSNDRIAALERERDMLTSKNAADEEKLKALQKEIEEVQNALKKAESTIGTSKEETNRLKAKLADLQATTKELSDKASTDKDKIKKLEDQLKQKDGESEKDLKKLQDDFEETKKRLDETNKRVHELESESKELQQRLSEKNKKLEESEIRTLIYMLESFIPQYYTQSSDAVDAKVDALRTRIISGFSAFIFENRSPKAQALLRWLIGTVRPESSKQIMEGLNRLSVIDVCNCIKYVIDSDTPQPNCMNYSIDEYKTRVLTADSGYVKNTILLQDLITNTMSENEDLWKRITSIDAKPSEIIRYYKQVLSNMLDKLREPRYSNLIGTNNIDPEQLALIYQYLLNIADTISSVLPEGEAAGLSSELGRITQEGTQRLYAIIEATKKGERLGPDSSKNLVELLRNLNKTLTDYDVDAKQAQLDAIHKNAVPVSEKYPDPVTYENTLNCIRRACKYSSDSYATGEDLNKEEYSKYTWFGDLRSNQSIGMPNWSGFIHYDEEQEAIFVAFHGTNGLQDMWTDAQASGEGSENFNGAQVHTGFLKRYNEIIHCGDMQAELTKAIAAHPGKKVIVTGHSLGGALATLAALDLVKNPQNTPGLNPENVQLITFCSPRVLSKKAVNVIGQRENEAMAKLLKDSIRIWRPYDVVPTVPMGSLGYKHFGISWCLDKIPENVGIYIFNVLKYHSISKVLEDLENHANSLKIVEETHRTGSPSPTFGIKDMLKPTEDSTYVPPSSDIGMSFIAVQPSKK